MTRYVIVGAGAVGVALAAGLSESGQDVLLVSRGSSFETIRDNGIELTHYGARRVVEVHVVGSADEVVPDIDDVIVRTVKTQDADRALSEWAWRPVSRSGGRTAGAVTPLLLTQNGLETERMAARRFQRVLSGVALIAASHFTPGVVDVRNAPAVGQMIIGAWPNASRSPREHDTAIRVIADLQRANWLGQAVREPQRWKAWKLLQAVTFPVDLLRGTTSERRELASEVGAEAHRVLQAAGHTFADPETELRYDPDGAAIDLAAGPLTLSPWQSFTRGSGSEIDFLNGEIALQAARKTGS